MKTGADEFVLATNARRTHELTVHELARRSVRTGPEDKVYPVVKLAMVIDALAAEGISVKDALAGVRISRNATSSPATRVSLNQIIECYRNANKLCHNRRFAYSAGLRFHVTDYGMYGFAMLSSTNYRRTMQFAVEYHQLATPLAEIDFKEAGGCGIWFYSDGASTLMLPFIGFSLKCTSVLSYRFIARREANICRIDTSRTQAGTQPEAKARHS
jgi:hypothetical protein